MVRPRWSLKHSSTAVVIYASPLQGRPITEGQAQIRIFGLVGNYIMLWTISAALLLPSFLGAVRGVAVEVPRSTWASKIQVYDGSFSRVTHASYELTRMLFRVRNPVYPLDVVDKLEEATMPNVDTYMTKKTAAAKNNKCTLENAAVRREWFVCHVYKSSSTLQHTDEVDRSDLTEAQRIEYTTAVKCLMKLPPKSDRTRFPGALSRFDDFVAYHMTHAMQLHDNIHLFGAHKYFVWLFEEALRNECNYTGYQPVRRFQ